MRIVKDAKERRNEILDCALELFSVKGYDNTSVNDIMNKVGIAKGTLYYHFNSKEEILNGILERIFSSVIQRAQAVANDPKLSIHEKLLHTLLSLQIRDTKGIEMLGVVHKPQNALMHQKMLAMMIKEVTPVLANVVEDGIDEGIFHTKFPYESAELFITYGNVIFDAGFIEWTQEELLEKVKAFICNMEKVFGTKEGEMQYVLQMFTN